MLKMHLNLKNTTMLKRFYLLILVVYVLQACGPKEATYTPSDEIVPIIPQPVEVSVMKEKADLSTISIVATAPEAQKLSPILQSILKAKNFTINADSEKKLALELVNDTTIHAEGYRLNVDEKGATIQASTGAGLFYGVQSFLQLVNAYGPQIPVIKITDYPRFEYRGMHLDVGRHMFPVEEVKKYIDLLAIHKMNRFHWHLTEDQGWRIEIKKYPALQEVGAYRKETVIGHASTADRKNKKNFDGKRYGGFYTQEEVKDIVKYAEDRYITVVPEIEMPGHALAALSAYPALGCTGGPYEAATTWGVFDDVFCAGKEETFTFLEGVMDEVIELFPGKYIHVGGDESPKTRWQKCPHCQKRIKSEKLKDEHALQSYFIQRMEKYLNSKGRQIIGWDEILEGGLAPNATVMSWRGEEGGIDAAKQDHDVIMTPGKWCYFDKYQDTTGTEPLAIGGYTPVSVVYSYEPVPPQLSAEEAKHVLGAQANVWTEYIPTSEHLEYMVYPRGVAMAEVLWTQKENKNYDSFLKRMKTHFKLLDELKVNYAKHILKDVEKARTSGNH
jgi:hexosaminidase